MNYLIILTLCILATSKMSFQSAFGKKKVKNTADAVAFNNLVFAVSALIFSYRIAGCSAPVWIYAAVGAIFSIVFQLAYTKALSAGNVSITVLIVNFSMVIVTLVSYFVYGDPISRIRFIGILLTLLSFVLCTDFKDDRQYSKKKWFILTLVALAGTSGASIAIKVFGESMYSGESQAYVSCLYIIASILTFIIYQVMRVKGARKTFEIGKHAVLSAIAVGGSLGIFQVLNTYAAANMDGTFFFPAYSGGAIVFSTLSGVFIFKDHLSKKQISSIATGVAAIALMSF